MATSPTGIRLAAGCGILYPVLLILGDDVIARGDEVASDAGTPEEVLANIVGKDETTFLLGRSIGMVSLVCLLVFTGYVASRIRTLRGPDSILPGLALGAGVMAATLQIGSGAFQIALVENDGMGVSPELAVLLLDFGSGFLTAMLPFAVLLGVVAVAGLQDELIGRTVARIAAVLAVGHLVGFVAFTAGAEIGFLPMPLTWLWFVAAGVSCLRRTSDRRVARPAELGPAVP